MINGGERGGGEQRLAEYLTELGDNDQVIELAARGVVADGFAMQLREIVARSAHGRTTRPILHMYVSPATNWTDAQYDRYLEIYEAEFGLVGQPRLGVEHHKNGRRHRHYVYSVVQRDGRVVDLRHDYARREKIARIIEHEFGEPHVPGGHNHAVAAALSREGRHDVVDSMRAAGLLDVDRRPRTVFRKRRWALAANADRQRMALLAFDAWQSSDGGHSFQGALADKGLTLAMGDQVAVVVDRTGTVLPLARLIGVHSYSQTGAWIKAAEIANRIGKLSLPMVADVRREIAMADMIADLDPIDQASPITAKGAISADDEAMLDACAQLIDDVGHEFLAATADDAEIQAWDGEALDQVAGLIDDAATLWAFHDRIDFMPDFLYGVDDPIRSDGTDALSARHLAILDEIVGVISAVDEILNGRGDQSEVELRSDIMPVEPTTSDPVQADPTGTSAEVQNHAMKSAAAAVDPAELPSSPQSPSSTPLPPPTSTRADQPQEQNHDERTDQRQSAGEPGCGTSDDEPGDGNAVHTQGQYRGSENVHGNEHRYETSRSTDRPDCRSPVERSDNRAAPRSAKPGRDGQSADPHSSPLGQYGRGNPDASATSAKPGRGGQKSVAIAGDAAPIHRKAEPVRRTSLWQNAATKVRAEFNLLVGKLGVAMGVTSVAQPRSKPHRSAPMVPSQPARNDVTGPVARPDRPASSGAAPTVNPKLVPTDRPSKVRPLHQAESAAPKPTHLASASKVGPDVVRPMKFTPTIPPSPIVENRVEPTSEPDEDSFAPGM